MTPLYLEDLVLPGIVTLGSGVQLILFARRVYLARKKYDVKMPAVTGNPDFERVYRAQQNTLEWYPIYLSALWTSSMFMHQVPSAICGMIYIYSRQKYFDGYSRSVEERLPGFYWGSSMLLAMLAMSGLGLLKTFFRNHSKLHIRMPRRIGRFRNRYL